MKKKVAALLCAIICVVSLGFAGCSAALSGEDRELINDAYETGTEFVENERQHDIALINKIEDLKDELEKLVGKGADAELLSKFDELTSEIESSANNTDYLEKLDQIASEIAGLKQEKEYSQEDIKMMLYKAGLESRKHANDNYFVNSVELMSVMGKESYKGEHKYYRTYNEETDVVNFATTSRTSSSTEVSGSFITNYYNQNSGEYKQDVYMLPSGELYVPEEGVIISTSDVRDSNVLSRLHSNIIDTAMNPNKMFGGEVSLDDVTTLYEYNKVDNVETYNIYASATTSDFLIGNDTQFIELHFEFTEGKITNMTVLFYTFSSEQVQSITYDITYGIEEINIEDFVA